MIKKEDCLLEANKCLLCKNARCKTNCPISTDIPSVIDLFKSGNELEAGKVLFENNPLSAICSIVCPHEKNCLGNCIKGIKSEPVKFFEIEQYLSGKYLDDVKLTKLNTIDKKVCVIGSGPAGITFALKMAILGYGVCMYDNHEFIGGVLKYGIPDFRLPSILLDKLTNLLLSLGVVIKTNVLVGQDVSIDSLRDEYGALFISTGVWKPKSMRIPGEDNKMVISATDYLANSKNIKLGDNVVVIGGGNVAMDAARSAKHYGSKNVTVVYRKNEEFMPACKVEIKDAKEEGVLFDFYKSPYEINEKGIVVNSTEYVDSNWITNTDTSLVECDNILVAVSQGMDSYITSNCDIKLSKWGNIEVDENGLTSLEGVYACGDVVTGAATVVEAVASAKKIVDSVNKFLNK